MLHTTSNFFNKYSLFLFTSESYNKVKRFKFLHFHFPLLFLVAKSAGSPADFAFPGEKFKYQFIGVINCVGLWPPSARRAQPFPRGEGAEGSVASAGGRGIRENNARHRKMVRLATELRLRKSDTLPYFQGCCPHSSSDPANAGPPSPRGEGCARRARGGHRPTQFITPIN